MTSTSITASEERLYGLTLSQRVRLVNAFTRFRFRSGVAIGVLGLIGFPVTENLYVTIWIAAALLTDALDGRLARLLRATTPRGAEADPRADGTLFIGVGIATLVPKGISLEVLCLYGIPSIGLSIYAIVIGLRRRRGKIPETSKLAKRIVVVVAVAIALSYSYNALGLPYVTEILAIVCLWSAFILSGLAFRNYLTAYKQTVAMAGADDPSEQSARASEQMRRWRWLPNFVTALRVMLTGYILVLLGVTSLEELGLHFLSRHSLIDPQRYGEIAFILTLIAISTDALDGALARFGRNHGWQTEVGKSLDPLADKWFSFVGLLGILLYQLVVSGLSWIPIIACALWLPNLCYSRITTRMRKRGEIGGASRIAKIKTTYLMLAQVIFMAEIAYAPLLQPLQRGTLLWDALTAMAVSAVLCWFALRNYRMSATITSAAN